MSTKTVAAAYGLALAGAGAFAWWRGKRGSELAFDTVVHGAVVGTGLAVVGYLYSQQSDDPGSLGGLLTSMVNGVSPVSTITGLDEGMGKLSAKAVKFLETIDRSSVLKNYQGHGVKVAPVPADPNIILLHED